MRASYGWPLFLLTPALTGLLSTVLLGSRKRQSSAEGMWATTVAFLTVGGFILALRLEGILCYLMASPIIFLAAYIGVLLGGALMNAVHTRRSELRVSFAILLPLFALVPSPPGRATALLHTTKRVMNAPPERIWPLLQNLERISGGRPWILRSGIAYPVATRTSGDRRFCVLTTGEMPERIVESDRPLRLTFDVIHTPPAMIETNPFGQVLAPHNIHAFRCLRGQFELRPLPGGRTLVVARTWYEHDYQPAAYWSLWTEAVVGAVHERVLTEIARRTR